MGLRVAKVVRGFSIFDRRSRVRVQDLALGARSRRLLMVITQEPTQSLTALHGAGAADACIAGEQQDVVLPLMIALCMVVLDVFAQCAPQGALAKEDYLGQALLLHRPNPALRIGIQVSGCVPAAPVVQLDLTQ